MRIITRHIQHYLPLVGILVAGVLGFNLFSYDPTFQFVVVVASAVGYVSWGLIHHHIHKDLHLSVALEYFVMALLGVVIIYLLLFKV